MSMDGYAESVKISRMCIWGGNLIVKVNKYVCGSVRQFAYWFAHGTLGYPLLEGIDYTSEDMKEESSFVERAFAIFMNNLELDEDGSVTNYKYSELRAAQYVRCYFDKNYVVVPDFENWEYELEPVSKVSYQK